MPDALTALPDQFEDQKAMDDLVNKVYEDIRVEKEARAADASEAKPEAETPTETTTTTESTDTPSGDVTPAGDDSAAAQQAAGDDRATETPTETTTSTSDGGQDWLDADLKGLATAYGVPEAMLPTFNSRQELERTLTILEAQAAATGTTPSAETQAAPPVEKKPVVPVSEATTKVEGLEKYLMPSDFDDGVVNPHNAFVKDATARIAQLEGAIAQLTTVENRRANGQRIKDFDAAIDAVGHPELFGVAGKRSAEEVARCDKVWKHHFAVLAGLVQRGQTGRTDKAFVERAVLAQFGPEIIKSAKQQVIDKLKKQSGKRMGGPANKSVHDASNGKGSPKDNPAVMAELKAEFARREAGGDVE